MNSCIEQYCRKSRAKGKRRCFSCCKKRYNDANPMRQSYHNLKGNAKRRGKHFDLTFEQFKEFAIKVNLLGKRGKTKDSYTVDRIRNNEGYVIGNLQRLSLSENSRKKKITYDHETKIGNIVDWNTPEKQPEDPF